MSDKGSRSISLKVSPEEEGTRLDRYVAEHVADRSRSYLSRLIKRGGVLVDGGTAKTGLSLKGGQMVEVRIPAPVPLDLEPEDIPLDIVHEDEHLAVIDKQAGLVVHPAAGNHSGTLVHGLLHHLSALSGIGDALRPGIVHRLDKDTSGLMVVAKSDAAHRGLVEMLAARDVHRHYAAIVWGQLDQDEGVVEEPVGRDKVHRKRMAVREDGKAALTRYSRMDSFDSFDYIRLQLGSGRTHQIRVHMAFLGHPILGDPVYGGRKSRLRGQVRAATKLQRELLDRIDRQALHAFELAFVHPVSGEKMKFRSPLPEDMTAVLELLREDGNNQGDC
ncbi:MAG: RluA family pseudouridine synthase [bacterium]|nr:RluA family pseudouridine synthase [bacterium]